MKRSPVLLAVLAAGLLATTACAPVPGEVTRLSTANQPACAFAPGSCEDLRRLRPPAW